MRKAVRRVEPKAFRGFAISKQGAGAQVGGTALGQDAQGRPWEKFPALQINPCIDIQACESQQLFRIKDY